MLLLSPLGALAEPTITIISPAEGDWTTIPDISVEGTSAPGPTVNAIIELPDLGPGTGHGVAIEEDALVLHPICLFTDGFDGDAPDPDVWTTIGTGGSVQVYGGYLRLFNDTFGDYPVVQSVPVSLPATDWAAEFKARFVGFITTPKVGGGLTGSDPGIENSHVAMQVEHSTTINEDVIEVFADGNLEHSTLNDGQWHTYAVRRSIWEDTVKLTMDGDAVSTVDMFQTFAFWFGRVYPVPGHYPTANIDCVDIWTFSGDWTSEIHDMGSIVLLEGASLNWNSTSVVHDGPLFEIRGSTDGLNWSEWIPCASALDKPLPCKYVQFKLGLALDGVKDESASLSVLSLNLQYKNPVDKVEINASDGDVISANGTERWNARVRLQEDVNTIVARAVDTGGRSTASYVNVTLDTTPPVGTVAIKSPRAYSNDRNVTLLLNATDRYGVASMGVADYPDFYGERVYPYAAELPWRIQGGFGENIIRLRLSIPATS